MLDLVQCQRWSAGGLECLAAMLKRVLSPVMRMVTGEDDDNHDKGGEMFVLGKAGGLKCLAAMLKRALSPVI